MSDLNGFVTRSDLDTAIADVREDIRETEDRLRTEFSDRMSFEILRFDRHLDSQDTRLTWILGVLLSLLVAVIAALVYSAMH